jgi:uncharacterized protein DUF4190
MSNYPPPAPPAPAGPPSPGWWLASDGRWYPPAGQPTTAGYGYGAPVRTSGLAIASLALGIVWLGWIGSVLAVIFGHVALAQVREGTRSGRGMAIAGLVLGYGGMALLVLFVVLAFTSDNWAMS